MAMGGQIFTLGSAAPQKHGHAKRDQADPGKDKKKSRRAEAGADMRPRTGYAPEAVMSDQDDWEFAGADDAKAEIRAAVGYLLPGATGGIRGDIVQSFRSCAKLLP